MSGKFELYNEKKGLWFWMMLSIGEVICSNPDLSASKTDFIVQDFIESSFYKYMYVEKYPPRVNVIGSFSD